MEPPFQIFLPLTKLFPTQDVWHITNVNIVIPCSHMPTCQAGTIVNELAGCTGKSMEIPFSSPQLARVAYDVMRVDKEPKRSTTRRAVTIDNSTLHVNFESSDLKNLRVAANSFFKHLILVNKTIDLFGPEVSSSYDHY